MVEHVIGALARSATRIEIPNVSFHHPEARTGLEWPGEDFVQVGAMAGREVVDADDCLAECQQLLQ